MGVRTTEDLKEVMGRVSMAPSCPDCGKKHFRVGQVLVRARWGRGEFPPGGYLLSRALQCKNCGYSPDYSGFIRRR